MISTGLKILLKFSLILTFCFLLFKWLFPIEGKFPIKPHIDTKFSNDFKICNFYKIDPTFDTTDVVNVLGQPISKSYDKKNKVLNFWYSIDGNCQWYDFAWECYSVHFNEKGKFIYKNNAWYYD
jgi:plasmid maintenance system killer protein